MNKPVKINTLEIQNVKCVKAISVTFGDALNIIGGDNGAGKTTILNSLAFLFGGQRYCPSKLKREGSVADPFIKSTLSNGFIVERSGKSSALKVTDPSGGKTGQQILNEFVSLISIDLPKFLNASDSEKAKILLQILGVGPELEALERQETALYNKRHALGQISDQKKKFALEMPCFDGVPKDLVSASELIRSQQDILARNGENQRKRSNVLDIGRRKDAIDLRVDHLRAELNDALAEQVTIDGDHKTASKSAEQLTDESTAEIEQTLSEIEETNSKVRANLDKAKAEEDAGRLGVDYGVLSQEIIKVRESRLKILDSADLPLPGLGVKDGKLIYNGQEWDCMSGSEQLRVGTAISRKMNPNCGFVLLDKAEQFDLETLREFGEWLESEGLQTIATRVSVGDECSIILEDGQIKGVEAFTQDAPVETVKKKLF